MGEDERYRTIRMVFITKKRVMNGLNGYLNDWFCVPFLNRLREG
jgi:hypothetical protein